MLLKVGIFSNSVLQRTIFLPNFCYLVTHAGTVNGSVQDESGYIKNWILVRHEIINSGRFSFKINLQFERYLVDKPSWKIAIPSAVIRMIDLSMPSFKPTFRNSV